jgi:hypothetical protein
MSRVTALLATAACAAALTLTAAPASHAGDVGPTDDLSGRWQSASLKMDGVGWALTLRPAVVGSGYAAVFQFRDQDGNPGARVRARITADGDRVALIWTGETGQRTVLKGSLGMDGSIFLPTCYRLFSFTTKSTADEACLFQEMPS